MANFCRSRVCMIFSVIRMLPRWVRHLCNLACVYALFKLISIARYAFESPWITFEETKPEIYREHVAYLHSILWRRVRLWLKLFANTVGRFLLRITSLSSYVFLRMVFSERSRTMAHTTRETVNILARKQLHLNHVVPERPKEEETYKSSKRNISSIR